MFLMGIKFRPSTQDGVTSFREKIDFAELLNHFCMVQDRHRALRHKSRVPAETKKSSSNAISGAEKPRTNANKF